MKSMAVDNDLLSAVANSLPNGTLSKTRADAARIFGALPFPTTKDEAWKYTSLDSVAKLSNSWLREAANSPGKSGSISSNADADRVLDEIDAHWLKVRSGIVDDESLADFCANVGNDVSVARLADRHALRMDDSLSSLNAALLQDGLFIHAAEGACLDKPIGLLNLDDGGDTVTQGRVVLQCDANSRLAVVECSISSGAKQFANVICEATLAAGARLDFVRIQQRDHSHMGTNSFFARLHTDAVLNHWAFDFGNTLARNSLDVELAAKGATARLTGLYLTTLDQHIDNHLRVVHQVGPTASEQNYRGILNGRSRCIWNGKAEVATGADGADANQSNRNLLLSDRAEIDTKPELEIYADDVKCSHGTTVGQLDEAAVFYLQSRGFEDIDARRILTRAFASEVLVDFTVDACREYLVNALQQRLDFVMDDDGK